MRKFTSDIEDAVAEIAEAFELMYPDAQDQLRALLRVAKAFSPTGEDVVGRAFRYHALEFGMKHDLCHQCAEKLVQWEGEWFCPTCDALLLAMRQERAIERTREAVQMLCSVCCPYWDAHSEGDDWVEVCGLTDKEIGRQPLRGGVSNRPPYECVAPADMLPYLHDRMTTHLVATQIFLEQIDGALAAAKTQAEEAVEEAV